MKKKDIILYLCLFAVMYTLYQLVAVQLQQLWFMIAYAAVLILSIAVYFIYGYGFPKGDIKREELPPSFTEEQKDDFIRECAKRQRVTRIMLVIALASATVFLFDIIFLYFGDTLKKFDFFGGK